MLTKYLDTKLLLRQIKVLINELLILIIPIKRNLYVFESFLGKQYSDNPKAIYQYLKKNSPDWEYYWFYDKNFKDNFSELPKKELVRRGSVKWFILIIRAQFWITNSRFPGWIKKNKHTKYLQTWHETPLKKLALDMDEVHIVGTTKSIYAENFLKDSCKWDYLISPNAYSSRIFRRCFAFSKTLIESGYPRNDILTQKNTPKDSINYRKELNIPLNKKIILYAPTWRDDYTFDLPFNVDDLEEGLGDDYFIILRLHYQIKNRPSLKNYGSFIKDFTDYNDVNILYLVSDILITDYSSVFFDFGILKRPMIFYCYDLKVYKDHLRGFYFDFENNSPGRIVTNVADLILAIQEANSLDKEALEGLYANFYNDFTSWEDGHATERVVKQLLK